MKNAYSGSNIINIPTDGVFHKNDDTVRAMNKGPDVPKIELDHLDYMPTFSPFQMSVQSSNGDV